MFWNLREYNTTAVYNATLRTVLNFKSLAAEEVCTRHFVHILTHKHFDYYKLYDIPERRWQDNSIKLECELVAQLRV